MRHEAKPLLFLAFVGTPQSPQTLTVLLLKSVQIEGLTKDDFIRTGLPLHSHFFSSRLVDQENSSQESPATCEAGLQTRKFPSVQQIQCVVPVIDKIDALARRCEC